MEHILLEWNPWWEKEYIFQGIRREKLPDILPWLTRREIISIMGVRRSGKTTLLFEIIGHLLHKEKIPPKNIFFIKADDERLSSERILDNALDEYYKMQNPVGKLFLFIDEIQEIPGWQKTLKRIYDLQRDTKIFISGSNSSLMNQELSSLLAGRYASFELFPFTFSEFLQVKGIIIKADQSPVHYRNAIRHILPEYLSFGAFPEVILESDEKIKRELIRFYFDSIFYRDVIKRKNLRNPVKVEKLVKYFLQNISNLANFTKIGRGLELSPDSVGEYVRALEDAYLIFSMNILDFSYKKQVINPKKIYCVDTGIRNITGFTFSEDAGRIYENIVYITLRRKEKEIFYWIGKKECDFIIKRGNAYEAIQVCYDLKNTEEKEVRGLLDALHHFKLSKGAIITENIEKEEEKEGKKIRFIPLWKWLLL